MMKSLFMALPITAILLVPSARADPGKGEALFKTKLCSTCHTVAAAGGKVGPDLSRVGARIKREDLIALIRDPKAKKPDAKMPKLNLTEEELNDLADYLAALK